MKIKPNGKWQWVVGHEGQYAVSKEGVVLGSRGKMLKPKTKWGYFTVGLYVRGSGRQNMKYHYRYTHTLVARAFIGKCPAGHQVNHRDGNKQNNRSNNLEYVTPSENIRHSYRIRLRRQDGEHNNFARLNWSKVAKIRALRAGGLSHTVIAQRFGVSRKTVSCVLNNKTWVPQTT